MGKEVHLASGTLALLLISFANLCLLASPALYRISQPTQPSERLSRQTNRFGSTALGLAFSSQILYLASLAAWLFHWTKSYPGNPIQTLTILGGLALSAGAFFTALLGAGLKRCAGVFVALTTGGLWLLSAIASVAI